MRKALYIGIFDPITLGHMDILERSALLVDHLMIGVMINTSVPTEMDLGERLRLVKKAVNHIKNVQVVEYDGRLEEFLVTNEVDVLIRGLRMMSDFENELNVVHANSHMNCKVDTVFLSTNEVYSYYSSKEIRQIAKNHGKIEEFLPTCIVNDVKSIYA